MTDERPGTGTGRRRVLGLSDASPDDLLTVAGDHILEAMAEHEVSRFVTLVEACVRRGNRSRWAARVRMRIERGPSARPVGHVPPCWTEGDTAATVRFTRGGTWVTA